MLLCFFHHIILFFSPPHYILFQYNLRISPCTCSSHLILGFPLGISIVGFHSVLFLTIVSAICLCKWLIHSLRIPNTVFSLQKLLYFLIYLAFCAFSSHVHVNPEIILNIQLSNILNLSSLLITRFVTTGLISACEILIRDCL